MREFIKTIVLFISFFSAIVFWFYPAQDLVSIQPVNWAEEYKDEVLDPVKGFGSISIAKAIIRKERGQIPIEQFIQEETDKLLITTNSTEWNVWLNEKISNRKFDPLFKTFLKETNPLTELLTLRYGFLKIENTSGNFYVRFQKLPPDELDKKGIPDELRFPYRSKAYASIALFLTLIILSLLKKDAKNLFERSTPAIGTKVFIGFLMCGIMVVAMPFIYNWMHDSPPFIFLGGFTIIVGIIGLIMFGFQLNFTARILQKGEDCWMHWTYDSKDWFDKIAKDYQIEKIEKRQLFYFITGMIILIGGGFCLVVEDAPAGAMSLVFLALIALLAFMAFIVPKLSYDRKRKHPGEVFIGEKGVYLFGTVHTWTLAGARLEKADLLDKPFKMVAIQYSYWMMAGRILYFFRNYCNVRIPVPNGKDNEAQYIVEKLQPLLPKRRKRKSSKKKS